VTPGSFHDLSSFFLLPLDIGKGKEIYMDRGYHSYVWEDGMLEAGLLPRSIRPARSKRYLPWMQYLAIVNRRVVETVGSMLHNLFPKRIHAVTPEGFVLKLLTFVLAHDLILLTKEAA
jgi:hypothetical protein